MHMKVNVQVMNFNYVTYCLKNKIDLMKNTVKHVETDGRYKIVLYLNTQLTRCSEAGVHRQMRRARDRELVTEI